MALLQNAERQRQVKAGIRKFREFIKTHPEAWLALYWPFHLAFYEFWNKHTMTLNYHIIYSPLDDKIPFVEYFVLPYVTWFFYIAAVLIYFLAHNKRDYLRATFMVDTAMIVSTLICVVYPSVHELRPAVFENSNLCTKLVRLLYSTDNPAVIMPSMHTSVSVLLAVAIWTSESLRHCTWAKIGSAILSTLIVLSTVLIKQHSVLDLFAGLGMAAVICAVTYLWLFRSSKKSEKTKKRSAV